MSNTKKTPLILSSVLVTQAHNKPDVQNVADVMLSKDHKIKMTSAVKSLNLIFPDVSIQHAGGAVINEYGERKHVKCVDAYSIVVDDEAIVTAFVLKDGSVFIENNFKAVVEMAGKHNSAGNFMRQQLNNTMMLAHGVNQLLATYKQFFGDLTEEHKTWMREHTLSYDQYVAAARVKAENNAKTEDNDSGKDK